MSARLWSRSAALLAALLVALVAPVHAQDKEVIRIGYVIAKTGPYAGGAAATVLPNYQLWFKEINEAGGLKLGDRRIPIEVIEYDDRSNSEDAVRGVERLITQDKVDIVLPAWGTAINLAIAPVLHRAGYIHFPTTSVARPDLAQRWPRTMFFNSTAADYAKGPVETLAKARQRGEIGDRVAVVNVADQFGLDVSNAIRAGLRERGFQIVYDQSYPAGSQDLQSIVNSAKRANPDAFVAMSYPPDSIALTDQARTIGFNPKMFYVSIGGAFPVFKDRFGDNAEGVLSVGGLPHDRQEIRDYIKRHAEVTGKQPDRAGSAIVYSSLQMLQQSLERIGKVDHDAIAKHMSENSFKTVLSDNMRLTNRIYADMIQIGQYQNGEFWPLEPRNALGARDPIVPKPNWK
jgi:branched-chain amino acid transport system substrate-binding protein